MPRQSKAVPLLNDQAVKAAKCIDGCRSDGSAGPVLTTYRIANSDRLELVVQPPNSGTYYVRYTLDGQRKRVRIGRRDKIALADARAEARRIAAEVDAGRDPASERLQAVDARAKAAASPPLRKLWEDRKAHGELRPATVATYEQALQQFVFPTLGDTPAATITKDQLNSLLKGVRDGNSKHRAHSVRGALGSIFSGALDQGDVATDPTDGLKFVYKAKRARERKSGADEIGIVWRGIENAATANNGLTKRMQAILKLVILTGQRVSTVCGARADELKLGVVNPVWTISAGRMKVEKEHAIPLTPHVAGLFREAMSANNGSEFVFPAEKAAGAINQRSVSHAMWRLLTRLGIMDLHAHDFRRTMASWMTERGIYSDVHRAILHHAGRDVHDRVYDRGSPQSPMREALMRWEAYVLNSGKSVARGAGAEETAAKVVQMRGVAT